MSQQYNDYSVAFALHDGELAKRFRILLPQSVYFAPYYIDLQQRLAATLEQGCYILIFTNTVALKARDKAHLPLSADDLLKQLTKDSHVGHVIISLDEDISWIESIDPLNGGFGNLFLLSWYARPFTQPGQIVRFLEQFKTFVDKRKGN